MRKAAALLALATSACASDYIARTRGVRQSYESYDYPGALKALEPEDKGPVIDKLLVLLDRGMILHAAGKYEESIKVLAEADKLSQQLDFTSVSEEASALVTNERERAYRGEDFEKLMVSVLQALNYAELKRDEDALVEIRRVNERMRKMINEEKKPYQQLAIARYLGGVLYEDQGDEDAAFIDYSEAERLAGNLGALADALVRLARRTGRDDAYRTLKTKYPAADETDLTRSEGQLVVVVEAGLSPQKEPADRHEEHNGAVEIIKVPAYQDRGAPPQVTVRIGDAAEPTVTVTSLREVAKTHLEDRIGRMVAKQLAGAAVKAGIGVAAAQLTDSKAIGELTFILLSALNAADLRSWLSLPAEFQIARFRLPSGKMSVHVEGHGKTTEHDVEINPGRVTLLTVRRY